MNDWQEFDTHSDLLTMTTASLFSPPGRQKLSAPHGSGGCTLEWVSEANLFIQLPTICLMAFTVKRFLDILFQVD